MHGTKSLLLLALLVSLPGCAMCTSCEDDTYSAYGGKWQRTDMGHGRVGSAFSNAGFDSGLGDPNQLLESSELIDGPDQADDSLNESDDEGFGDSLEEGSADGLSGGAVAPSPSGSVDLSEEFDNALDEPADEGSGAPIESEATSILQ